MARLWRKDPSFKGCKYLVKRRDGTIPDWEWFVLGERDRAAVEALYAYARRARELGYDPDFVADILQMATDWEANLDSGRTTNGDPDAPRHRKDDEKIVAEMMTVPWIRAQAAIQEGGAS